MAKKIAKPAEEKPAENIEETKPAEAVETAPETVPDHEPDGEPETAPETAPAEEKPAEKHFSMTPLEEARLKQFKRMFPRECELLIAEHDAARA